MFVCLDFVYFFFPWPRLENNVRCLSVLILYIFFFLWSVFVGQCEVLVCLDYVHFFFFSPRPQSS